MRSARRHCGGRGGAGLCTGPIDLDAVTAEPPRDPAHGDIATNAAMVLNKAFGKPPRVLAEAIAAKLRDHDGRRASRYRWPRLHQPPAASHAVWPRVLDSVLGAGRVPMAAPTWAAGSRPMSNMCRPIRRGRCTSGHCRGAVFGDALAQLLAETGYRRHARILHQRRGRPGRRARPLGLSALSRGAGRNHRRNPAGPLSRRLSEAGRRGAGAGAR